MWIYVFMTLISTSSHVEPSYHLLFMYCEKSGKQLYLFFKTLSETAGCRHAVEYRCKWMPLQFCILPCIGSKPLIYTYYSNFYSFILTSTRLIEENNLAYSFYLRINVTSLSWEFSFFIGRKEMAGMECTEWNIPTGSCWRDDKRNSFILMTEKNTIKFYFIGIIEFWY